MTESFSDLLKEVLSSPDAGAAMRENTLRRKIAAEFEAARLEHGLSVRELAERMGTSVSQVQRLRHESLGGSLTLRTLCRAAHVLGLAVTVNVRRNGSGTLAKLYPLGSTASWQVVEDDEECPTAAQAPVGKANVPATGTSSTWKKLAGDSLEVLNASVG